MKELMSLAWKEWRESRWFLLIGLVVFLGLPLTGAIQEMEHYSKRFEFSDLNAPLPWVVLLGGVLAIFVSVGVTCRDFNRGLEEFWRSRPVSVGRWLLVKYFVGLGVVLAACVIPLVAEIPFDRSKDEILIIAWFPFLWAALYSIGFLAGCLVRRAGYAAMLGLSGMLLVYFLPVVLPPLQWLNVTRIVDLTASPDQGLRPGRGQIAFGAGMLGLAILGLALAVVAVRRDWRIGFGRKLMYGSVSAALLILSGSAAFRLGTNMPVLREIDMPRGEYITRIYYGDHEGYVITETWPANRDGLNTASSTYNCRTIKLTESGIEMGKPVNVAPDFGGSLEYVHGKDPMTNYYTEPAGVRIGNGYKQVWVLNAVQFDKGTDRRVMQLWDYGQCPSAPPLLCVSRDRLYAIGARVMTMDISQPLAPRVIFDEPLGYVNPFQDQIIQSDVFSVNLPAVPGLSAQEVLQAVMGRSRLGVFDGKMFYEWEWDRWPGNVLLIYRVKELTQKKAVFEKVGRYEQTLLENLFASSAFSELKLQDGLLYVKKEIPRAVGNPRIDVFDTRGGKPVELVGHFASPDVYAVFPLPDGNVLVGGTKLLLVGPPPRRGED